MSFSIEPMSRGALGLRRSCFGDGWPRLSIERLDRRTGNPFALLEPRVDRHLPARPHGDRVAMMSLGSLRSGDPVVNCRVGDAERLGRRELGQIVASKELREPGCTVGHELVLASGSDRRKRQSLGTANLAAASLTPVGPTETLELEVAYATKRLRAELMELGKKHGGQSALSRKIDITTAHLTNVKKGKARVGAEMLAKLLVHGGLSRAELTELATGVAQAAPRGHSGGGHGRAHSAVSRAAAKEGYSDDEAEVASIMIRDLERLEGLSPEMVVDLLRRSRMALQDGRRSAVEALERAGSGVVPKKRRSG
jgi:plasmid maintenance system antidote protein VapI